MVWRKNEVRSGCVSQLLRLLQLHPDEDALQVAGIRCLNHLAFEPKAANGVFDRDVLDALMKARLSHSTQKIADEATARIIAAANSATSEAARGTLTYIYRLESRQRADSYSLKNSGVLRCSGLPEILKSNLAEGFVDAHFLVERLLEALPSNERDATGWLSLLTDLIEGGSLGEVTRNTSNGTSPSVMDLALATTSLMSKFQSLELQRHGVEANRALAVPWKKRSKH